MEEKVTSVDMKIKAALNEASRKNQRFKERKSFFLLMEMKLREFEKFQEKYKFDKMEWIW